MNKKKSSGITLPSQRKSAEKAAATPAAAASMPKPASNDRSVITYRLSAEDKRLLSIHAVTNGTKVQTLINQALKLLAVERDIPFSDEIMKS